MRTAGRGRGGASWAEQLALPRMRLGLLLVSLSVLFFGVNFGQKVVASYQVNQQVLQLEQQIAAVNAANEKLEQQIQYYETPSYVIAAARSQLYQHSGDTVFRIAGSPDPS